MPTILEDAQNLLSTRMRALLTELRGEWENLEEQIDAMNREFVQFAAQEEGCRRLLTISGIGPLTATALVAVIVKDIAFRLRR